LNFKGTPSQEEHKTTLSDLSKINRLRLDKVALLGSFQQPTIHSVTLTFRSLSFPESQFSKILMREAISLGKDCSGFLN
jgi:hypothetical protein